jgi:ribosomal protein L29
MALPPKLGGNGGKPLAGLGAAEPEFGKSVHATDELTETCETLETELEELKVKYEMYFLGVERFEPAKIRDDLKRKIARLKTAFTRNTGLRFRIQSLHARYLSYERLWLRAAREKEEGTYRRDVYKARLRHQEEPPRKAGTAGKAEEEAEQVDLSQFVQKAPASAPVSAARAAVPRAAPSAAASGLGDPQMRALYDAYVEAKRRCKEDVSKITYDAVAKSVQKQIPEIMTRYNAKAVDFKVVIKGGKAVLKAVPKT